MSQRLPTLVGGMCERIERMRKLTIINEDKINERRVV